MPFREIPDAELNQPQPTFREITSEEATFKEVKPTVADEIQAAIPDIVSKLKESLQTGPEFTPQQLQDAEGFTPPNIREVQPAPLALGGTQLATTLTPGSVETLQKLEEPQAAAQLQAVQRGVKSTATFAAAVANAAAGTAVGVPWDTLQPQWERVKQLGDQAPLDEISNVLTAAALIYGGYEGLKAIPQLYNMARNSNLMRKLTIPERGLATIPDEQMYQIYKTAPDEVKKEMATYNPQIRSILLDPAKIERFATAEAKAPVKPVSATFREVPITPPSEPTPGALIETPIEPPPTTPVVPQAPVAMPEAPTPQPKAEVAPTEQPAPAPVSTETPGIPAQPQAPEIPVNNPVTMRTATSAQSTGEVRRIADSFAKALGHNTTNTYHEDFAKAIINKDAPALEKWVVHAAGSNPKSQMIFKRETGIDWPTTIPAKREALYKWAGMESPAPKIKPIEPPKMSKEESFKLAQQAKADKILDTKLNYSGKIESRRQHLEKVMSEGGKVVIETTQNNNAVASAQKEIRQIILNGDQNIKAARVMELNDIINNPPTQTKYRVVNNDGSFHYGTKAEYDYYLSKLKSPEAPNAQKTGTQTQGAGQEITSPQGPGAGVHLRNDAENRVEAPKGEVGQSEWMKKREGPEWEAYAAEQNKISREQGEKSIIERWKSTGVSGNGIANFLRAKGVSVPESIAKGLEHDDTTVSSTEVSGKMKRPEARRIHRWVSENMAPFTKTSSGGPSREKALPSLGPVNPDLQKMGFPKDSQVSKGLRLYHVVDLFKEMEGGVPAVVKQFRKPGVMGKAWQTGKIKLHSLLGQNEQMASLVLAHEIAHVADALYGDTTQTFARGNILGRIGSMNRYMYDNLAKSVKTKAEMADEIKAIKGNYLEEARKAAGELKGPERAKFVREKMSELAAADLSAKGYISKEEITAELAPLARWWNQSEEISTKPEELYAEAMSVYITSPKDLAQRAPKFYEATTKWLAKKPEFEEAVKKMWATLEQEPEVGLGKLYNQILKDAHEGEVARAKAEDMAVDTKHVMGKWAQMQRWYDYTLPLTDAMLNKGLTRADSPFKEVQQANHASVISEAYATEIRDRVFGPLNKSKYLTPDILHAYLFTERVRRGNLEQDELGNMVVTVGDRSMKLNSRGVTPQSAQEMQDLIIKPAVKDEWPLLREIANNLYDQHQEVLKRYGEGPFGKELNDKLMDNEFYVTFEPTKYLEGKGGGNAHTSKLIYTSVGDLGPIANTVVSTVIKDMNLISSLTQSIARQRFAEWGIAMGDGSVVPAERKAGGFFDAPPPNYETVYWLWDGKVQAAHVHKDWLPIVKNQRGELENFFNSANTWLVPFKYAYVNLRAAFFFVNIFKDTFATYSNLPEYKFFSTAQAQPGALGKLRAFGAIDAMTRSFQELPAMIRHQIGKETSKAVQDAKWAGVGASHYAQELTAFAQGLERVLRKRGVYLPGAKYDSIQDKAMGLLQFAVDVVNASDMATKTANFKMLKGLHPEMSDAWIADVVNTRVGTPDTTNKGSLTPAYNWIFMYSHVAAKGWQGSWRSFKEAPGVYAAKAAGNAIFPRIIAYGALLGYIGRNEEERKRIQKIMQGVPEYFMAGSLIVPLGLTEKGKSVFLTIPQDEATRVIGAVTYYTLKNMDPANRDSLISGMIKSAGIGMDYAQNQMPGPNPWIKMSMQLGEMWALPKGEGPTGGFGQPLIPERIRAEYPVSKKRGWGYLGRDIVNNTLGLGQFYKFSDNPDEIKGAIEKGLGVPLLGDVVGRFLRVSAAGAPGGAYEAKQEVTAQKAFIRNNLVDTIKEYRDQFISDNGREPTKEEKRQFYRTLKRTNEGRQMLEGVNRGQFIKSFNNYTTAASGRIGKMLTALKSGSNEAKVAALLEYSKSVPADEMKTLIDEAIKNKFITPKVRGQYRRSKAANP